MRGSLGGKMKSFALEFKELLPTFLEVGSRVEAREKKCLSMAEGAIKELRGAL